MRIHISTAYKFLRICKIDKAFSYTCVFFISYPLYSEFNNAVSFVFLNLNGFLETI